MPLYSYRHPVTNEIIDIYQNMGDNHIYIDSQGVEWDRVWYKPQMALDTKINEFDSKDFVEKTARKKGSMGDIWDEAKHLSEKREQKMGKDELREKYYSEYSKKRKKGVEHPDVKKRKLKEELSKKGVDIEF